MKSSIISPALALAMAAVGHASFNQPTITTSVPLTIDSGTIFFTAVTHKAATINWKAPGLGDWKWPILGYRIQVTDQSDWQVVPGETTPGTTTDISYDSDAAFTWGTCPTELEVQPYSMYLPQRLLPLIAAAACRAWRAPTAS